MRALFIHEAAHAIVAGSYGFAVEEIRAGSRSGHTAWRGDASARQSAVVTAAGMAGQKLAGLAHVDLSCSDLARFEAEHGLSALWRAQRQAERILADHRDAWLGLASRLETEPVIRFATTG